MVEAIKRIITRLFPELVAGHHLPRFAVVQAIADPTTSHGLADEFRPRYCVDVQVLLANGKPDTTIPILKDVPLPIPMAGHEQGQYGYPGEGTQVVIAFAYGLPNKPFIQQVLAHGLSLPKINNGDQLWQQSESVYQSVDKDGNWTRTTHNSITDDSVHRIIKALVADETYQQITTLVNEHSTEEVGGMKIIEAMGLIKLLSGGRVDVSAIDNINLTTTRDINSLAGGNIKTATAGNLTETIKGIRQAIAKTENRIEVEAGGKVWVGDNTTNILKILSNLCSVVSDIATTASTHVHPSLGAPTASAANFVTSATTATTEKTTVDNITAQ